VGSHFPRNASRPTPLPNCWRYKEKPLDILTCNNIIILIIPCMHNLKHSVHVPEIQHYANKGKKREGNEALATRAPIA